MRRLPVFLLPLDPPPTRPAPPDTRCAATIYQLRSRSLEGRQHERSRQLPPRLAIVVVAAMAISCPACGLAQGVTTQGQPTPSDLAAMAKAKVG